jgi:uncharacterized protein (TIGR02118 family)
MLKVCTAFKRKQGLSFDEYQCYWSGEHPAYVKRLPQLLGYAQNRPLRESFDLDERPHYDGLVELWFRDNAALKTMTAAPEFEVLCEDEHNFADRSSLKIVFTVEHLVHDGAVEPSDVKRIVFMKRGKGATPEAFQERLTGKAVFVDSARRLVFSLPRLNGYANDREPAWDGYEMAWFPDLETALAAPVSLSEFSDAPRLYCSEHVIVRPS